MMNNPVWENRAHGKLLLTGEYAVLDGALALALPLRYGQRLRAEPGDKSGILLWKSLDHNGKAWFEATFSLPGLTLMDTAGETTATILQAILRACRQQAPAFLNFDTGLQVITQTDFPREWGLGTSSTLIALLARWAGVDPYRVLFDTFGGSGYDIACAFAEGPLLYRLINLHPEIQPAGFHPVFSDRLFFVFLGKKQNSREGIRHYRQYATENRNLVDDISAITRQCLQCADLGMFTGLLLEHERLIGRALGLPRAQDLYFADFPGVVKSLGAWGGDFVLAAGSGSADETFAYFKRKGCDTCIPYGKMVL